MSLTKRDTVGLCGLCGEPMTYEDSRPVYDDLLPAFNAHINCADDYQPMGNYELREEL